MEVFGLGVRIKEEGAATVEAALNKLQKQFSATTKAANDFAKAITKIGESGGALRLVVNDLDATARTAGRLNVAQNNLANSSRNVRDALSQKIIVTGQAAQAQANLESSLIRSAKQFAATTLSVTGIVMAIRQLVMTSDEMMLLEGRINLVADSTANLRELQDKLYESAQKTRSSYASTSELYARVARNSDQLGYSQEQLLRFSELTQMSIRTSGINAIEASRGMIQLSQALASGVLRGDEFRAVMEQMPGTARAIAEGLGVPIGKLREMANAGQLTAQLVMDAILRMDSSIRADFEQLPVTIGDGFTRIGNAFQKSIVDANQVTGATNTLGEALSDLAKNLEGPLTQAFIGAGNAAKGLTPIFQAIGDTANFIADNFKTIKATLIALAGVIAATFSAAIVASVTAFLAPIIAAATGLVGTIAAFGFLNVAIIAVVASIEALKLAIAAIPGLGLAIVGLTALFAYLNKQLDDTNDLYEEMDRVGQLNMEKQIAAIRAGAAAKKQADAQKKELDEKELARLQKLTEEALKYNAIVLAAQQERRAARFGPMQSTVGMAMERLTVPVEFRDTLERTAPKIKPETFVDIEGLKTGIQSSFSELNQFIAQNADISAKIAYDNLRAAFTEGVGGAIKDGLKQGIEGAIMSGTLQGGFRALSQSLISNLANVMVDFAINSQFFGKMMDNINKMLAMGNGLGAVVAAGALLAFAYANGGKSTVGSSQIAGGRGGSVMTGFSPVAPPVQQIIFGATSATTAAGMQPRQAMNVTVIGPNDPSAQRAIQELMTKANSRGRIG
jgi:tape measure domain-containing protein